LVAVAWAQSLVRDPARRELLHELDVARQALMRVTPKAEVTENIDRVYANLVRMWVEP
jgi:PKHD-type hydroxylase